MQLTLSVAPFAITLGTFDVHCNCTTYYGSALPIKLYGHILL